MDKPVIKVGGRKAMSLQRKEKASPAAIPVDREVEVRLPSVELISELNEQALQVIVAELKIIFDSEELTNDQKIARCVTVLSNASSEFEQDNVHQTVIPIEATKPDIEWEIPQEKQATDDVFLENLFPQGDDFTFELINFFYEELQDTESTEEVKKLAILLKPSWQQLMDLRKDGKFEDFETMQQYHKLLSSFLKDIVHVAIPFKKRLLLFLAQNVNSLSSTFQFVSPENAVSVEPMFHNVVESNGTRIKAGLSYLVVRKANKQTVVKADVVTY